MNKTRYLQTDSRWSKLPFRNSPDNVGNNGCGMVSICNAIIEMKKYANYTPATMQPYCRQFVVPAGYIIADIPVTMKHYGLTDVKEHATMDSLWKELAKGNRVAVYLMGNRPGGSKKVHWTSGGHFVSSVAYQHKDGDHWVYMKDSASNSSLRNGWMSYKGNLRGDVSRVWSGKLSDAPAPSPSPDPKPTPSGKLDVDGIGGTATVRRMQEFFGTTVDGVIGGQLKVRAPYYPALQAVSFGRGGSRCIYKLQEWLGLSGPDGVIGPNTTKAWQRKLRSLGYFDNPNESIDGIFGVKSMKAWQECLNNNGKKKGGTPTPDPKPTPGKETKVIDVSEFQDSINWNKVKAAGIDGAIIRCGFRGATTAKLQEDAMFLNHIKGAHKAGVKCGIYMFTEAINEAEGRAEADYAIAQWKKAGVPLYYPIAVDTEKVNITGERARNLTKAQRTSAIKGFCERIKELGYSPMIYASTSWLDSKLDMSKLPYDVWVAQYYKQCQYKGKYVMWQYTSTGKVSGVSGNVDLNHCYIEPEAVNPPSDPKPTPPPTPSGKGYTGKFPTYRLTKSNAEVISDTVTWAKKIASNNDFHYGYGKQSHHNGCFYCGTQPKSKKNAGIKMWETTYCCNPFVGAAWAHGGGDATAYKMCHKGTSWDFGTGNGSYHKSKLFDNLGKPAQKNLKPGDVLCGDSHVALYIGNGKVVQAGHQDDNKINSSKWNSSISVGTWGGWKRAYRYNSTVDCDRVILKGEYSTRVADLQRFLVWYGYKIKVTGFYNSETLKAVIDFQEKEVGKGQGDGSVGPKTIEAMKKVKK